MWCTRSGTSRRRNESENELYCIGRPEIYYQCNGTAGTATPDQTYIYLRKASLVFDGQGMSNFPAIWDL